MPEPAPARESSGPSPVAPAPTPSDLTPDDEGKALLAALRVFIRLEAGGKTGPSSARFEKKDLLWFVLLLGCIPLGLALLPRAWLKDELAAFLVDKIAPWFLSLGVIANLLKSPDSLLGTIRGTAIKWLLAPAFLLLLAANLPIFKVQPQGLNNAVIFVDGSKKTSPFRVNFNVHEVELRTDSSTKSRTVHIEIGDLMSHFPYTPDWRLIYTVQLELDQPFGVCFKPQGFTFDRDFVSDTLNRNDRRIRVNERALEYTKDLSGGIDVPLPSGTYIVSGFRKGCGLTKQLSVTVPLTGSSNPQLTTCVSPSRTSPCDEFLSGSKQE